MWGGPLRVPGTVPTAPVVLLRAVGSFLCEGSHIRMVLG